MVVSVEVLKTKTAYSSAVVIPLIKFRLGIPPEMEVPGPFTAVVPITVKSDAL
jgi:hypothetical protein